LIFLLFRTFFERSYFYDSIIIQNEDLDEGNWHDFFWNSRMRFARRRRIFIGRLPMMSASEVMISSLEEVIFLLGDYFHDCGDDVFRFGDFLSGFGDDPSQESALRL